MKHEINESSFVNLANDVVGTGLLKTGQMFWELAQKYAEQEKQDHANKMAITEDYLKGLYSYLDMILDAEINDRRRELYGEHQDIIRKTIQLIQIYKV